MKLTIPLVFSLFAVLSPVRDEGQWLPRQVLDMDWAKLKSRGMELTKDEFWHPEKGGVLSATVQIGGCTASFCSPEGLVVTNHHCGFGAVQKLSTPERNYLKNGYVAATRADELPASMQVLIVRRIEDITEKIRAVEKGATSDADRVDRIQAEIGRLVAEGQKAPNTVCSVSSFLNGTEYHLYHRTRIQDVRLVYAPPRSVGEYGGEDDNWEWPRHTGDFMFFRAYVAPDGTPKPYSKDNVPFKPEHHLKVSAKGVSEGDLVVVMGYPGRTERYLSSEAIAARQNEIYPRRYEVFTKTIEVLQAAGLGDEAKALELSTTIKSLANSQKNALGMVKGLARNGTLAVRQREEAELSKWIEADPDRRAQFGTVLQDMITLDRTVNSTGTKDFVISAMLSQTLPMITSLVEGCDAVAAVPESRPVPAGIQRLVTADRALRDLAKVQVPIFAIAIDEARRLKADDVVEGLEEIRSATGTGAEIAADILKRTKMTDPAARGELFRGGQEALKASEDPLIKLARGLARERRAMQARQKLAEGRRLDVGRKWIAAQQAWRGTQFYPDANSTLRVSIATVRSYSPRDGVMNTAQTTVAGLLAKATGKEPFECAPAQLAAAESRKTSRFVDARLGDVPVCFLSDADTTGGNSGSPVINGKGELVGLNFDRVFEAVAGDFGWNADRSRNVSVDIRYIAWFLESVIPAPHLMKEMGL